MGVPSFYRWLLNKYPEIRVRAKEDDSEDKDSTFPNPNGVEFDNLYLDMNGIIHPCFHPEDHCSSPPTTYEEVFLSIFGYIDRLFSIVRPRKLLYMAIDGVAPRAKMNQQRTRRFRTARDNEIAEDEEDKLRREFEKEGKQVLPKVKSELFDSNVITPGTEFMHNLSIKLKTYIRLKISNDPGWKDIQVILSDANVPGEGEHKIMLFIRAQRCLPGYNANTRHCIHGLDADLIPLTLATHEVHFSVLREDVLSQEQNVSGGGCFSTKTSESGSPSLVKKPYEFVHIWILRQYLELDIKIPDPPQSSRTDPELDPDYEEQEPDNRKSIPPKTHELDLERIIDDFVFMCFFAGNDFLPHMPTLEIRERCINLLLHVYKKHFTELGGYLVDMEKVGDSKFGFIKLKRVEKFILFVGTYEEEIFKKRLDLRENQLKRFLENAKKEDEEFEIAEVDWDSSLAEADVSVGSALLSSQTYLIPPVVSQEEILKNTEELKEKLRQNLRKMSDLFNDGPVGVDKVNLGIHGWKQRYYKEKFSAETAKEMETIRKEIVQKYTEGLIWVLLYYYSGVPSWTWFYPYHYGPFASDLKGLAQVKVKFNKGLPFKPFDQLMGVLPPRSAHALPESYAQLMTDETSSIIDFYPKKFDIDTDGKRFTWQGICKLKFIDEDRLLSETKGLEAKLKEEETNRNSEKHDQLFVGRSSKSACQILTLVPTLLLGDQNITEKIDATLSGEIGGFITLCDCHQEEKYIGLYYQLPKEGPHLPRPLEGVNFPEMEITEAGMVESVVLWHEYQGNKPYTRPLSQERYGRTNSSRNFGQNFSPGSVPYQKKIFAATERRDEAHKFAGSGWGYGRGRTDHFYEEHRAQTSPRILGRGSSYPINSNAAPFMPSIRGSADQWKVAESSHGFRPTIGRGQSAMAAASPIGGSRGWSPNANQSVEQGDVARGVERLRVSESSHSFRPNSGRGQFTWMQVVQGNEDTSTRILGRGLSYPINSNAAPFMPSIRGSADQWKVADESSHGGFRPNIGRGQSVMAAASSIGGSQGWFPNANQSVYQGDAARGMERLRVSETTSHSFRPNIGRGQFTWKQVVQGNEDPSTRSIGRGQWNSKDNRNQGRNPGTW